MTVVNKTIEIEALMINPENYRFLKGEEVKTEKEAINKILEVEKDRNFILNLARHLTRNGINPTKKVIVISFDKDKFKILDGNRRITSIKILNNPNLISNNYNLFKSKIIKLNAIKEDLPKFIDCSLFDNEEEAKIWIKLEHTGENKGVGTIRWDSKQIQNFNENYTLGMQVHNILKESPLVSKEVKVKLKNLKITNLDRLLQNSEVKKLLGIKVKGKNILDIKNKEIIRKIVKIVESLIDHNVKVSKIYNKEQQVDYVNKILNNNFKKISEENVIVEDKELNEGNSQENQIVSLDKKFKRDVSIPKERKTLIPKECKLKINNQKVKKIYQELQQLELKKFIQVSSISFRVFVELTMDCYMENHKLIGNSLSATKCGKDFKQKVFIVANHLQSNKKIDLSISQGIKNSVNENNGSLGADTLHSYLHNSKFSPIYETLITMWDNIEDFMKVVWENIN
jgi:hypothetical protein